MFDLFDTGDRVAELVVERRQLGPMIEYADHHLRTSGVAAEVLGLFNEFSTESVTLPIRIHRKQTEVTPVTAQLHVIASRERTVALGEKKGAFHEMFARFVEIDPLGGKERLLNLERAVYQDDKRLGI